MKPENIDNPAQRKRRRDAIHSAIVSSLMLLLSAAAMLILRAVYLEGTFWGAVLLIMALIEAGMIIPVFILLRTRLKEIEGGEEDAAAQY